MNGLLMTVVPWSDGVLEPGAVEGHLVGDPVDDHGVLRRVGHGRGAELHVLGDHALIRGD